MGSKNRVAKYIVPIIQKEIDDNNIEYYGEFFVGGANVIDKIKCKNKIGTDIHPQLIALLKEVQNGNMLLPAVSKELYNKARKAYYDNDTELFNDWELGCIGFLASYNGRWFDGGYAKSGWEKTKTGQRWRDYYKESKSNILQQANDLKDIKFGVKDYRECIGMEGWCIYADPPYKNVKKYANAIDFNYDEFWEIMRKLSKDNIVLISEQEAPEDFVCIWEQKVSRSIKATDKSFSIEKLFKYCA